MHYFLNVNIYTMNVMHKSIIINSREEVGYFIYKCFKITFTYMVTWRVYSDAHLKKERVTC